ncbi:HAMP domain-containing protein [Dyella sp. OK004]|uniref:ATP-binding protein n=1 Tax=Dyella sp. OK004 TaxID=1855292 RepID=UPI0008EF6CA5|nr:ATP-binding protein [Dyella sp. OK004]SFS20134.1 HAMP domain-containing protein [Dyella sp. OK004]
MHSLRSRLFVVLLGVFVIAWAITLICLGMQFARERTGVWDRSLGDIGREILLSMPSDIRQLSGASNLHLAEANPPRALKHGTLSFQVWIKTRRDNVVRSPGSSPGPLKPDFVDGYATRMIDGQEWRVYAISDVQNEVQVQVAKPTSELVAETRRWVRIGLGTTALLLIILGIAMKLVIRWSLRPVTKVQEAITVRDARDLDPLPSQGLPDEVRPLVESFNRLLGRLDRAMQNERQFLAEAAHELRTPLAALLTHAQVALRSKSLDEAKAPLQQLVRGVERSARLSQQLLDSARLDAERHISERGPIELADIVAVITHEFETAATAKCQSITLDTEPCQIEGNVDDLGILIGNLIDNAVRYTGTGGRLAVCCVCVAQVVRLQVLDDGPGVVRDDHARIFDRFFRVAGSNERGSGIGLSLVARIAESHGATIEIGEGIDGRGFGITVVFPALQERVSEPGAVSTKPLLPA